MDQEKVYAYWLTGIEGVGVKRVNALLNHFQNPQNVYEAETQEIALILDERIAKNVERSKALWKPEEEYAKLEKKNIHFTYKGASDYPKRLIEIPDAPYSLYYKGEMPSGQLPSVAIIGARACSDYGKYVAGRIAQQLAKEKVQIISGLARGIDSVGQKAACEAGGKVFAVLGSGVDVCYPPENYKLFQKMEEQGGIISEYGPGVQPQPGMFPVRNRIISGLADLILVVEARKRSGTYITVTQALEQGREVYAVPGRVTDALSEGCNFLISQGAGCILNSEDILQELKNRDYPGWKSAKEDQGMLKEECEDRLLALLDVVGQPIQEILEKYSNIEEITIPELCHRLIILQMEGKVAEAGGEYRRL